MRIALDAMGGDFAPQATVEGAVMAARDLKLEVTLVGDKPTIENELRKHQTAGLALTIEHAAQAVTMEDSAIESVLGKPDSSLHVGYELLKRGEVGGFVSAGNSGAMLTTGIVVLGNLAGVDRPAIASLVPSAKGHALLIDAGANVETKAKNLVQFAAMGSVYWRHVRQVARPRVGILSNGEEASKGTDVTRAAAAMLREMPEINYVGYVEGRDINQGRADVVVTDGFTGNVTLKTMEGMARFLLGEIREILSDSTRGKLAYLLVRKRLDGLRRRLDPAEYGGAPLLGVDGVAIISHGSSNPLAIRSALRLAAQVNFNRDVRHEIIALLARIPTVAPVKAEGKGIRGIFTKMREMLHLRAREAEQAGKPEAPKVEIEHQGVERPVPGTEVRIELAPCINGSLNSAAAPHSADDGAQPDEGAEGNAGPREHSRGTGELAPHKDPPDNS